MFSVATDAKLVAGQLLYLRKQLTMKTQAFIQEFASDALHFNNCIQDEEEAEEFSRKNFQSSVPKKYRLFITEHHENESAGNGVEVDGDNFIEDVDYIEDGRAVTVHKLFQKAPKAFVQCKICISKSFNANGFSRHYKFVQFVMFHTL
jgi:hypothetical protein